MNFEESYSSKEQIVIRQLTHGDSRDLISAGFPFGQRVLRSSLQKRVFQAFNFHPYETSLVAYHINKGRAIGYLSLVAHSRLLYSIRYVFSDPNFRRRGVATGLVNYSLTLAKNSGAKKVFLTADLFGSASKLYEKLGFKILSEYPRVEGTGHTSYFQCENQTRLVTLQPSSLKDKTDFFNIYKNSMGQNMINFFDINSNNFVNGYSQDFQHFYIKNAFVNGSDKSLALVFHLPFTHTAVAELYGQYDVLLPDIIKALMNTLYRLGITYTRINLFNTRNQEGFNLLEKKRFYPYQGIFMGKSL